MHKKRKVWDSFENQFLKLWFDGDSLQMGPEQYPGLHNSESINNKPLCQFCQYKPSAKSEGRPKQWSSKRPCCLGGINLNMSFTCMPCDLVTISSVFHRMSTQDHWKMSQGQKGNNTEVQHSYISLLERGNWWFSCQNQTMSLLQPMNQRIINWRQKKTIELTEYCV